MGIPTLEDIRASVRADHELRDYLCGIAARRVSHPGDDVLTRLVQAQDSSSRKREASVERCVLHVYCVSRGGQQDDDQSDWQWSVGPAASSRSDAASSFRQGQALALITGAANRDPEQFDSGTGRARHWSTA